MKQDCPTCRWEDFVERKWNREFVWVQIPQTGNVTVPEDQYDRFYRYASAEPPNYPAACKVLVDAAAADTVMTAPNAELMARRACCIPVEARPGNPIS